MKTKWFVMFLLSVSFLACSGQTEKTVRGDQQQAQPREMPTAQQSSIPPGHCRIVGTLVTVDSTLEQSGPCSKAPCRGIVRIDSIIGYGSAFGNPLAVKKEINVRFAFTLAATTPDLFPNMTNRLPGLTVGAQFTADLASQNELGMREQRISYLVQEYRKLN